MVHDINYRGDEAKGADFIYSSIAFPLTAVSFSGSLLFLRAFFSPGGRGILERSLVFLFTGEFV
jgi:hypothetical protein